jgi:hypothetical protein
MSISISVVDRPIIGLTAVLVLVILFAAFDAAHIFANDSIDRSTVDPVRSRADFDGDGRSDISILRPSTGTFYILNSRDGMFVGNYGTLLGQTSILCTGDFDGNGSTDIHLPVNPWVPPDYRPWSARPSVEWPTAEDRPVCADHDGDSRADVAFWRPSTGEWRIQRSSDSIAATIRWGTGGDLAVPADYDGDGTADIAVFRPSEGTWYICRSTGGGYSIPWGTAGDKPVQADYDGDNKDDLAVFRPSDGSWYILKSSDSLGVAIGWGSQDDIPVPADYDGDGRDDIAQYRPSTGRWNIVGSSWGLITVNWGGAGDIPLPSLYLP